MAVLHPTDRAMFWLAAVGFLVVGTMMFGVDILHDLQAGQKENSATVPKPDVVVDCWAPSHFAPSMVKYTDTVCKGKIMAIILEKDDRQEIQMYHTFMSRGSNRTKLPAPNVEKEYVTKEDILPEGYDVFMHTKKIKNTINKSKTVKSNLYLKDRKTKLYWYIAAQFFLTFIAYICASNVGLYSRWYGQQLSKNPTVYSALLSQRKMACFYMALHVLMFMAWLCITSLCYTHCVTADVKVNTARQIYQNEADLYSGGIAVCGFSIPRLGNTQEYTVECGYEVNLPPSILDTAQMHKMTLPLHLAAKINVVLVAILCVMSAMHVIHTFIITPMVHRSALMAGDNSTTFQHLAQITRSGFALTDLNIVLMFGVVEGRSFSSYDTGETSLPDNGLAEDMIGGHALEI